MNLWQDLRLAARRLAKDRGLAIVAVVSLALGIGANAIVFSTLRALLLRDLPVASPERVFFVQPDAARGLNQSFLNYIDLRDRAAGSVDLMAYRITLAALDVGSGARFSWGYLATGNYFEMLGVRPVVGRFFTVSEDIGRNASPYVVLSYPYWRATFAGDRSVPGRVIRISGRPYTVLGVAPDGFYGTEVFVRPDYWVPMTMARQVEGTGWIDERRALNIFVAGRVHDALTRAQAETNLNAVAAALAAEYPAANEGMKFRLTAPGLFGDILRGPISAFMAGIFLLAILVLVAACTNLASLLVARVVDRSRELAVRLSLGASRQQITRQLLVETFLLCALGGLAGIAVAFLVLRALSRWDPPNALPFALDVLPDMWVLAFAVLATIAASFLAVAAAARRAWRMEPATLMRPGPTTVRFGRWSVRDVLLGLQVSLCCLLVIGTFVSIRGLDGAFETRLGFNPDDVFVSSFELTLGGYDREQGEAFRTRALEAIAAQPGVDGATFTSSVQLTTDQSRDSLFPDSAVEFTEARAIHANAYVVPPGYFDVLQTRLLAGRDFEATDTSSSPRIAIVNQTLARQLFGASSAVGRRFRRGPGADTVEVIGVVEDGKYAALIEQPRPAVFWAASQAYRTGTDMLVRSRLSAGEVATLTRRTIAVLNPSFPVVYKGTLRDVTSLAFLPAQAATIALGAFGLLAMVLAVTGIYGLAAYAVSARTREIGIRVAVGGAASQVLRAVLGRVGIVLATGAAVGAVLAFAASPLLAMVVHQASSRDPLVLAAAAALMGLIGLTAAWAPARRALSVDPAITLRES
jgi:predicted permease